MDPRPGPGAAGEASVPSEAGDGARELRLTVVERMEGGREGELAAAPRGASPDPPPLAEVASLQALAGASAGGADGRSNGKPVGTSSVGVSAGGRSARNGRIQQSAAETDGTQTTELPKVYCRV